jgi:hypothetical protein
MTIVELLQHVGSENVQFQMLIECVENITVRKRGSVVTFGTPPNMISPNDLLAPNESQYVGMVVWLPRDKMPKP